MNAKSGLRPSSSAIDLSCECNRLEIRSATRRCRRCASKSREWFPSITTEKRFTSCALPTRCSPAYTTRRRGFGLPCSTRRTRQRSGRSSVLAEPAARESLCVTRCRSSTEQSLNCQALGPAACRRRADYWVWSRCRGLPADRIPRLHAVAEATQRGRLDAERLRAMSPEDAQAELQQLPGIGPFYSSLIVIRACGHADAPTLGEPRSRAAIQQAYGIDHELGDAEMLALAESWRPFRTWVAVMMRALSPSGTAQ